MLNLDGFTIRDLQNCLHLLTTAEAEGITDARFLRARITEAIERDRSEKVRNTIQQKTSAAKYRRKQPQQRCPDCGRMAVIETVIDGERICTCTVCRWSVYRGEAR